LPIALLVMAKPAIAADAAMPVARIETGMGTITIALDRAHAPVTVANFIRYARGEHFDGTVIYRVEPGYLIQAGSFDAAGHGRSVHNPIAWEGANGLKNERRTIAMARDKDPVSATAEWFINLRHNDMLDHKPGANSDGFTVFGQVTGGMEVADAIAHVKTGGIGPFEGKAPLVPVVIKHVEIADPAAR
jgi:cyclophilin family peptidyl-prolyl cis-trans isomerase